MDYSVDRDKQITYEKKNGLRVCELVPIIEHVCRPHIKAKTNVVSPSELCEKVMVLYSHITYNIPKLICYF